jgi:hypothetical protein
MNAAGALQETAPHLTTRASQRLPELDALRGLMLILMTLAHLPTQARVFTNQQLGFVTEAEGFIFLSAFLSGRIFWRIAKESGFRTVTRRLWTRALRLYGYHLFLLATAFTVVAVVAVHTKVPSVEGLVDYYLAHRILAICSSVLLIYCPPLLDILPLYIIFLLVTPLALYVGSRWGWKSVLIPGTTLWLFAQFGLRTIIDEHMMRLTGLKMPLNEFGAFDLLAWQWLWVCGLWIGTGSSNRVSEWLTSRIGVITALILAVTFLSLRHLWWNPQPGDVILSALLNKWRLGGLRILDFASLAILFTISRHSLARYISTTALATLGKSSLQVFCAHLLFCFAALCLFGDGTDLPVWTQAALIAVTLICLYLIAKSTIVQRQ